MLMPLAADTGQAVLTAGIAAVALVLGGALTATGTVLAARSKLAEAQLAYRQQLQSAHYDAARQHVSALYLPLSAALSALADAFLVWREQPEDDPDPHTHAAFADAVTAYVERIRELTGGGMDAFLTVDLDTGLRDFSAFLRASLDAGEVHDKLVVTYVREVTASLSPMLGLRSGHSSSRTLTRTVTRDSRGPVSGHVSLAGFGLELQQSTEVLAAPLGSFDFETRFQRDVAALKDAIRDVTLGARRGT